MSQQVHNPTTIRFGDDFELDPGAYELRRAGQPLKLERIPLKLLFLLAEHPRQLVPRDQIVERIWGSDIHLDTDNSINGAVRKIRQALGDSCENPRFIQTVTGEGYRFMAPVQPPPDPVPTPASIPALPLAPGALEARRIFKPRYALALAVATILFTIIFFFFFFVVFARRPKSHSEHSSPMASRSMLAVLPFENLTGDSSQEYFSDGITEELIAKLGSLDPQHLGVIARTSVMHYKGSGVPLDRIGRELGVQYVIEGSVRRDPQHFRITAQLIEVKDQTHVWAKEFDREPIAVLTVQDEIAQAVSAEIRHSVGNGINSDVPASPGATASSYEAFDLYLKGRFFWNKRTLEGFQQAASYFQQSTAKDPNYARAYAGLADTYGLMSTWFMVDQNEFMPRARAAALRALEIDDTLAEAHTSLGLISENYQYDWKGAEKEFLRAIQLNPDYATAHQWYAELLSWEGRFDEAFAESERARQLDPLSLIIASDHGALLYFSRQYDRAVTHCKAVLAMDPHAGRCSAFLLYSLVELGRFPEALDTMQQRPSAPDSAWALAQRVYLFGRWGRTAEARAALEKLKREKASMHFDRSPALLLAYSGIGAKDQTLALLEEAYSEHSNAVSALKVDPPFDFLRGEPRFQNLLHRLALN